MSTERNQIDCDEKTEWINKNNLFIVGFSLASGVLLQSVLQVSFYHLSSDQFEVWITNNTDYSIIFGAVIILAIAFVFQPQARKINVLKSNFNNSQIKESEPLDSKAYLFTPYLKSKYGFLSVAEDLTSPAIVQPAKKSTNNVAQLLNERSRELSQKLARLRLNRMSEKIDHLAVMLDAQNPGEKFSEFKQQLMDLANGLKGLTSNQKAQPPSSYGIYLER